MGSQQFLYIPISWHSRMDSIDENTSKLGHLEWHCWKQIGSNNIKQVCIPGRVPCMCCSFKARVKLSQSHCAVAWNCRKYATPAIVQEYFKRLKHHHGIKTATPVDAGPSLRLVLAWKKVHSSWESCCNAGVKYESSPTYPMCSCGKNKWSKRKSLFVDFAHKLRQVQGFFHCSCLDVMQSLRTSRVSCVSCVWRLSNIAVTADESCWFDDDKTISWTLRCMEVLS